MSLWLPYTELTVQAHWRMNGEALILAPMLGMATEPNAGSPEPTEKSARDAVKRLATLVENVVRAYTTVRQPSQKHHGQMRHNEGRSRSKLLLLETQAQHFDTDYGLYVPGAPQREPCAQRIRVPEGGDPAQSAANFKNLAVALGAARALAGAALDPADVASSHVWSGLSQLRGADAHWHHGGRGVPDSDYVDMLLVNASKADCTHGSPDALRYMLQANRHCPLSHRRETRSAAITAATARGRPPAITVIRVSRPHQLRHLEL